MYQYQTFLGIFFLHKWRMCYRESKSLPENNINSVIPREKLWIHICFYSVLVTNMCFFPVVYISYISLEMDFCAPKTELQSLATGGAIKRINNSSGVRERQQERPHRTKQDDTG